MHRWAWLLVVVAGLVIVLIALVGTKALRSGDRPGPEAPPEDPAADRARMVEEQIAGRGVRDPRVLDAIGRVPRHRFVPERSRGEAYGDYPLSIGFGQTISQPYIVAYMTELAAVEPGHTVLEVGTGSGYQAAVLAELASTVYTVEIIESLAAAAETTLRDLGYDNIHVRHGDGYLGWPDAAPFDAIVVTAAPDHVPEPLVEQLAVGGRLVVPVGGYEQRMRVITKTREGVIEEQTIPVRFVPLTRDPR